MRILRTDSHFRPTAKSGRATASKLLRQTKNKDGIKYTIYKYDLFPDERIYHARVLQIWGLLRLQPDFSENISFRKVVLQCPFRRKFPLFSTWRNPSKSTSL